MKQTLILATVLGLLLYGTCVFAGEDDFTAGTIINSQGEVIRATAFVPGQSVIGEYKGQHVKVLFTDLNEITVMNKKSGILELTNKKGKTFTVKDSGICGNKGCYNNIAFKFINPISGKEQSHGLKIWKVRSVSFRPDKGPVKYNPKTGNYYPAEYLYDPFTGAKLVFGDPDQ